MIFTDWYYPAFKAGGPVQSVINMVERFKDRVDFYIVTGDRDLNELTPFEQITTDVWLEKDGYHICYRSPKKRRLSSVRQMISSVNPDVIYLNSMFSDMYKPIWVAAHSGKVVVAPRGMLRPSALAIKPLKKYIYLWCLRTFLLDRKLKFHATGEDDFTDVKRTFPQCSTVFTASNLPAILTLSPILPKKAKGSLRLVSVGRIHPIKNILFLLKVLLKFNQYFELDIIATTEDDHYRKECLSFVKQHLGFGDVRWHLNVPHEQVSPILSLAHLFVSPTKGENFGHAIFEALSSECPVLVSDQTPWKNLFNNKAGFDLPLDSIDEWANKLRFFAEMDDSEWGAWRLGARSVADDYLAQLDDAPYLKMFGYES